MLDIPRSAPFDIRADASPDAADAAGRPLALGLGQIATVLGDLAANERRHLALISEARAAGVDCLLFPEMSLTGHSAGCRALDLAIPATHPIVRRIAEASGPMRTTFGVIEEGPGAQFYNTALTVAEGRVVHVHRKINLATYGLLDDGKHFAPGRYIETFALDHRWRAATLVCNDMWNPALVSLAAQHGATILLAPVSSAREAVGAEFDNPSGWATAIRYSAMVYGMPVVFVNRVGREDGLSFWGGSCVVDPFGRPMEDAGERDGLTVSHVDFDAVRRARYVLPTVRDSNLDLIVRETTRLQRIMGVPDTVRDV